jgi:hypothetical protein
MKTNIYIRAAAAISPLQSVEEIDLVKDIEPKTGNSAICIEPNFKNYIPPIKARRMSRIIKLTSVSAKECLKRAEIENPEMISVATGMGCQVDTIKFLQQLIADKEEFLKPTAFINSTHNTLAGYLAIDLKSKGQNFSFTHNELNFEHALLDSIIRLNNNEVNNVLVGAVDEISEQVHSIKEKMNLLCANQQLQNEIYKDSNSGYIDGENAVFFTLEKENTSNSLAKISALDFAYDTDEENSFEDKIIEVAKENDIELSKIDAFLIGSTGKTDDDAVLEKWIKEQDLYNKTMRFKHLSGENMVSAGFGLWLGANIIKQKFVPDYLFTNKSTIKSINSILLINHNGNNNFSFILVQAND